MRWPGEPKASLRYGGLQVREEDCSYVWKVRAEERCSWVRNTSDCQVGSLLAYPSLLFCSFGTESWGWFGAGLGLLLLQLLYLFLILGTTADNFFCPSLSTIASVLHLSENIAGVTILAFGNGSPDIFTSLVASEDERLIMFTELIGAGVFVSAVIGGSVAVVAPFRVQPRYFVRDALFYVLSTSWICYIVHDNVMQLWEALSCIAIYAAFILVVVAMQSAESSRDRRRRKRMPMLQDELAMRAFLANEPASSGRLALPSLPSLPRRSRAHDVRAKLDVAIQRELLRGRSGERQQAQQAEQVERRPRGLLREFLYDVNPVNARDWRRSGLWLRALLSVRAPFMLLLQLLLPVVNETAEKRGWSRLLNCLQLALSPLWPLCILGVWSLRLAGLPLPGVCLGCSSALGLLAFARTSDHVIPRWHNALAFLGFLMAMLLVYAVAQEVMALLQTVGFASGVSDAMLGISLLAWGNSVGDLISNVTIARRGYPRMGFSACFGGPMFNTLLGLGLSFGISAARSDALRVPIRTSDMAAGCLAFLLCSLLSSLIYLTLSAFAARRSYGFLLYSVYALFMLVNVLSELHVIHPLGTDHRPDNLL